MSNPSPVMTSEENPATAQAAVLLIIIVILGFVIFGGSPTDPASSGVDSVSDVISNPQIDTTDATMNSQTMTPIAMFNLENPNGWATPETVTIVGTFQDELGCALDSVADCMTTTMNYDILGDIWRATFEIPAGAYSYRAYLNSGEYIYGKSGISGENSQPINLELDRMQNVSFYYDHKTGWITDDVNSLILTMPSNFQDNVGCIEEWNASCFRTWMQDVDGDGIYTYETLLVPGGSWEARVAVNGNIETSYGQNGEFDGDNFPLWIPNIGHLSVFAWDSNLKTLTPFISQIPLRLSTDLPIVAPNR